MGKLKMDEIQEIKKELKEMKQNQNKSRRFWILVMSVLIIFGGVFAGSHYASQILTGTFLGNYTFNSSVSFSEQPSIKQSYYYLPKNSQFQVDLANSNCVDNGANYKCTYEPDLNGDGCPDDMARVGGVCVDKYEASYNCSINASQTTYKHQNITSNPTYGAYLPQTNQMVCKAISEQGRKPYVKITQYDSITSCLLAGKRLISNREWQMAARGTPDEPSTADSSQTCNVNHAPDYSANGCLRADEGVGLLTAGNNWDVCLTGTMSTCKSDLGIYDIVGNVWEWTSDIGQAGPDNGVSNGYYTNTGHPTGPYGADGTWNIAGVAYGRDNDQSAWFTGQPAAFLRGGGWDDGANAGVFALDLDGGPSYWDWGIGFRCSSEPTN